MADLKPNSIKRDIWIALTAAVIAACLSNTLILYSNLSAFYLDTAYVISQIIAVIMILNIHHWRPKADPPRLAISSLLFVFGAMAVFLLFNRYWMEWYHSFDPSGEKLGNVTPLRSIETSRTQENIFSMFIAPVSEEIVFRLGILGILCRVTPRGLALVISSVLFAIPHLYVYSTVQIVLVLVLGIMAGFVYIFAGLGYSILLHALINSWPYLQAHGLQSKTGLMILFLLCVGGLIVFLFRIVRLRKLFFRTDPIL
jgi:membrane protease YdiL (CAAX protease family)